MPVIAIAQFLVIVCFLALYTFILGKLQDTLPSHLRSGASSAIGTMTSLGFMPLIIIFSKITEQRSVFIAAYLLLPLAIVSLASSIVLSNKRYRISAHEKTNNPEHTPSRPHAL